MADPKGFLKYSRELPARERPETRIQHSREFVSFWNEEQAHRQSSRCMNCGVPFCHNGCPLGNLIPEFNDAVYRGRWKEAYEMLVSTNNFPEFTGRICPAPCESACVLGINQPAVAIEEIEKHIIEHAFTQGWVKPRKIFQRSGKKVAVVGSGPAGLAAADQLNKAGHLVAVFERDDKPGGLLRYGIPDFKLDKNVLNRRINMLEDEGIIFRCNVEVGQNISTRALLDEFDALVLAGGSTIPRDLGTTPGRQFKGVHVAMEYLKARNKAVAAGKSAQEDLFAVQGKNVVVIGGGDTGSDCVGTSLRLGAASVTQFELLPMPPKERTSNMPWPAYPMILRTSSSQEEGCDRRFAVLTKAFIGDTRGRLRALQIADLSWTAGPDGRPAGFQEVPGSEREIPCELALLAMGFLHPPFKGMLEELKIELDERGNVRASEQHYQTSVPKVFVAGDMRRGQSLVVWAISEGRECARKVDEYLMGSSRLETKETLMFDQR